MIQYRGQDPYVRDLSAQINRALGALRLRGAGAQERGSEARPSSWEEVNRYVLGKNEEATLAVNRTLESGDLNRIWFIEATAAIDVTLPVLDQNEWIVIVSKAASTNNITLKDSGGTTITTITPGGASGQVVADSAGTEVPF